MIKIKSEIERNYNIKIKKIYRKSTDYYFFTSEDKIYIKFLTNSEIEKINSIVKISNEIYSKNKLSQTLLITIDKKYMFEYKNKKIALLKANKAENDEINFNNILETCENKNVNMLNKYDIINEWKNEIDNIERKLIEYNKEYPIVMNHINYYIGLGENAICLLNQASNELDSDKFFLNHNIQENKYSMLNFSNPFNYIRTFREYDLANYLKYEFYNNKINFKEIDRLEKMLDQTINKEAFLAIIIFPKEIFDLTKKILEEHVEEKNILFYTKKIKKLESFINYIQKYIIKKAYIKWLEE